MAGNPPEVIVSSSRYRWSVTLSAGSVQTISARPNGVSVETSPAGAPTGSADTRFNAAVRSIGGIQQPSAHAPELGAELRQRCAGAQRADSGERSPASGGV
jgi:hypothetical protein